MPTPPGPERSSPGLRDVFGVVGVLAVVLLLALAVTVLVGIPLVARF